MRFRCCVGLVNYSYSKCDELESRKWHKANIMSQEKLFMLVLVSIVALTAPQNTLADWQYTRWGMTAEEIVAASDGNAHLISDSEKEGESAENFDAIALGTYSTGPFEFEVSFRALKGEHTLDTVRLELREPSIYRRLREALIGKYGIGQETVKDNDSIKTTIMIWKAETETVKLIHADIVALGRELVYLDYSDSLKDLGL